MISQANGLAQQLSSNIIQIKRGPKNPDGQYSIIMPFATADLSKLYNLDITQIKKILYIVGNT